MAKVDGQVEVLLVTGKAVEQQGGGARIVAGGAIEAAEKTRSPGWDERRLEPGCRHVRALKGRCPSPRSRSRLDRKSTRLNSSHGYISYAVFCLKKKSHPFLFFF